MRPLAQRAVERAVELVVDQRDRGATEENDGDQDRAGGGGDQARPATTPRGAFSSA